MLHEKYLPRFHFSEKHSIIIKAKASNIWPIVVEGDLSGSWVIRLLFALRGMPARMTTFQGLHKASFIRLEQIENEELIIGLIGQFWKSGGNLQVFNPEEFSSWDVPGFLKASWNFELFQMGAVTRLETETRVLCLDDKALRRFKRYWFFIRPFSGVIRREMLRGIKRKAEKMN
ncbi:MAG: hypothetical protein WKF87_16165 [Chryseolinea sp.]